jgi:hypothetical protein
MATITQNKQLTEPNINDLGWGLTLNTDFSLIDQAFGASYNVAYSGTNTVVLSTPTNTGLTPTTVVYWWTAQQWNITSSTQLTGDLIIQIPSGTGLGGAWIVNNYISFANMNGHNVFVQYGTSGSTVNIGQGKSAFIYLDGNGIASVGTNAAAQTITSVSAATTLGTSVFNSWVFVSGSTFTVTMPPVANNGATFNVHLAAGSTAITFSSTANFVGASGSAATTMVLASYGNNYVYTFVSTGTNWYVFSSPVASNSFGRVSPRVNTQATVTSFAWNSNYYDQYNLTAQASAFATVADSGTPVDGQKMIFRIYSAAAYAITGGWPGITPVGVVLPTTTVAGKTIYIGCIYNASAATWNAVAVNTQA